MPYLLERLTSQNMLYFLREEGSLRSSIILSYLKGPAQTGKPSPISSQVRLLVSQHFSWPPSWQTKLKTISQSNISWENAALTDKQGQRSHIASYNRFGPLNISGDTSSPGKAVGDAALSHWPEESLQLWSETVKDQELKRRKAGERQL